MFSSSSIKSRCSGVLAVDDRPDRRSNAEFSAAGNFDSIAGINGNQDRAAAERSTSRRFSPASRGVRALRAARSAQIDRLGHQQRFASRANRGRSVAQLFVQNPFVPGVLVDDEHPFFAFGNQVAVVYLDRADRIAFVRGRRGSERAEVGTIASGSSRPRHVDGRRLQHGPREGRRAVVGKWSELGTPCVVNGQGRRSDRRAVRRGSFVRDPTARESWRRCGRPCAQRTKSCRHSGRLARVDRRGRIIFVERGATFGEVVVERRHRELVRQVGRQKFRAKAREQLSVDSSAVEKRTSILVGWTFTSTASRPFEMQKAYWVTTRQQQPRYARQACCSERSRMSDR